MTVTERAETRSLSPRDPRLEPWRAFLHAHARITRRLDEELRARARPVARGVRRAADHRGRAGPADPDAPAGRPRDPQQERRDAADRPARRSTGWSSASVPTDARGAEAVLTPAGLDRLRRASRTHLRGVAQHFLGAVEPTSTLRRSGDRCRPSPTRRPGGPPDRPTDRGGWAVERGRLFVGTSGFAYPDWYPRFYPKGLRGDALLRHYATRLAGGRAEQHVLPVAQGTQGRRPGWRRRRRASGSASRPSAADRGGPWAEHRTPALPWLTDPYRAVRRAARDGAVPRAGHDASGRRRLAAMLGRVAARPPADRGGQRPTLGRRRDGRVAS